MQLASMTDAAVVGNDLWILAEEDIGMNMSDGIGSNQLVRNLFREIILYPSCNRSINWINSLADHLQASNFGIFNISNLARLSTFSKSQRSWKLLNEKPSFSYRLPARSLKLLQHSCCNSFQQGFCLPRCTERVIVRERYNTRDVQYLVENIGSPTNLEGAKLLITVWSNPILLGNCNCSGIIHTAVAYYPGDKSWSCHP